MKQLIVLILLCSSSAYAIFPKISAHGVSGYYKLGDGVAYAEYVEYELPEVKLVHKNIDVKFNKPEKNLVIFDNNTSVSIKFDFSFMNVFQIFDFKNVALNSENRKFAFNVDQIHVLLDPQEFTLNNVKLVADLKGVQLNSEISFLEGFLINGELNVDDVLLGDFIEKELLKGTDFLSEFKKNDIISKVPVAGRMAKMHIHSGKFEGQVLLDSWINLWLRFGGDIYLSPDEKKLEIVLNRAKLGYFSIKSFVLKKLAKIQNERIKVEGNKITIEVDPASD